MPFSSDVQKLIEEQGRKDGTNGVSKQYELYTSPEFNALSNSELVTKDAYIKGYMKGVQEINQFKLRYTLFCIFFVLSFALFVYGLYSTVPK